MKFDAIGRVEKPEELDLEPVTIPIVGYKADVKRTEVTTEIKFHPLAPLGVALAMLRSVDDKGNIATPAVLDYLDGCVLPESREAWERMLNAEDCYVTSETWSAVYSALGEHYANRPSLQRPGSRSGASKTRPTTRGAASSRGSGARTSR
jgi:hypothetical protein